MLCTPKQPWMCPQDSPESDHAEVTGPHEDEGIGTFQAPNLLLICPLARHLILPTQHPELAETHSVLQEEGGAASAGGKSRV